MARLYGAHRCWSFVAVCALLLFSVYCGSKPLRIPAGLDTPETAYAKGNRLLDKGSYVEAQAAFERSRVLNPAYAPAYEGLSRAAFALGNRNEAIRFIQIAKIKDANYVPVWTFTGMIYLSAKRYQEAITEFQEALQRDPDRLWATETYLKLGNAYEQTGQMELAHETYMAAVSLDPLLAEARAGVLRVRTALGPGFVARLKFEGKQLEILP